MKKLITSTAKLSNLITTKKARIGILGMGYVGQALAEGTTSSHFTTLGFDIDKAKISEINAKKRKFLGATDQIENLKSCHIICVCVPTPVNKSYKPNLSIIQGALVSIAKYLQTGQLIVIESSVAPGTTRNLALPILEKSGLVTGKDFFLAHSPERIDPGNNKFTLKNTPKVVGALDEISQKLALQFYKTFVKKVVPVSSVEAAEMTKVLENTFRLVNISFINEVASFTKALGIDAYEVIEAASTKPYGFLAHFPGPGAGGDCIPVLPYHFMEAAKKQNIPLMVTKAAAKVNELQPKKVAQKAIEIVNGKANQPNYKPKVMLVGVSYKAESKDLRHSPALKIWESLEKSGMTVSYHDPHVPKINGHTSQKISTETLKDHDLIVITTAHKKVPYQFIIDAGRPVLDTRNILSKYRQSHIFRL